MLHYQPQLHQGNCDLHLVRLLLNLIYLPVQLLDVVGHLDAVERDQQLRFLRLDVLGRFSKRNRTTFTSGSYAASKLNALHLLVVVVNLLLQPLDVVLQVVRLPPHSDGDGLAGAQLLSRLLDAETQLVDALVQLEADRTGALLNLGEHLRAKILYMC